MAVTIANSTVFNTAGYNSTHTISGFDCSGTDSHLVVASFNKNPTSDVSGITADGNAMTLEKNEENANVAATQMYAYKISDNSFDIVASTPGFKQEAFVAMALSGANQTDAVTGTPVGAQGFGSTATAAYTGTSGNLLIVAVANDNSSNTFTASGCTEVANFDHTTDIHQCFVGSVTATGSEQTIGATISGDSNYTIAIIEIAVVPAVASNTGAFFQMI